MARAERQAQVMAVAEGLFARHGFHHISMDMIADGAEVAKPVLYRHFPSKLELYLAVVDERGRELVDAVARALAPLYDVATADGQSAVRNVVSAYVTFAANCGGGASLLFESDIIRDEQARAIVEAPQRINRERIADVLEARCGLDAESSQVVAAATAAMAQGAATALLRPGGDDERPVNETHVDLVTRLAWHGIASFARDARDSRSVNAPASTVEEEIGTALDVEIDQDTYDEIDEALETPAAAGV